MNQATRLAIAFVAGVAVTTLIGWLQSPGSLEECFVREARGLPSHAASVAYSLCEKRFPKPVELLSDADLFGAP